MESVKETLLAEIVRLWQEIANSGKDEFNAVNQLRLAKICEHETILKELEKK